MKKALCTFIIFVLVFSSFAVNADTDTLFSAFENKALSANTRTEMTITLNKPFDFINQLLTEEELAEMPIDVKMLAESICTTSESLDMSYLISDDNKKIKLAASAELNVPLELSEDFKADIWARVGMWLDMDLTDETNPIFKLIFKVPFSNEYFVFDYTKLLADDEYSAQALIDYLKHYSSNEMLDGLNAFYKKTILENMTIKETSNNREYILTTDDEGFKNIIKSSCSELYDLIIEALGMQENLTNSEYRYQFEQYLSVFDNFQILGNDGFQIKVSLKNKHVSITDVSLHINCNLYDVATEFGADMTEYDREKWWLDFNINVKTTYENANQNIIIDFPEITEENSVNVLNPYDEYESNYLTISTTESIEPDENGNFSIPLDDAMRGCFIAKNHYTVDDGIITITYPDNQKYPFSTVIMNVGSDVISVDGVESKLYTKVYESDNGIIYIPIDAITTMTGYELMELSQILSAGLKVNYIDLYKFDTEYEEDYIYISSSMYIYDELTPIVENDELYIPLRQTVTEFGIPEENILFVDGAIVVTNDNSEIPEFAELKLKEFSNVVYINSAEVKLNNPIIEKNGKAYIPSQLLKELDCTLENVTYYFEENPSYRIFVTRNKLSVSDWIPPMYEENYLYIADSGAPVVLDGEYYLPLWPLMGELMVSGDDILEIDSTVTVISTNPATGFKTLIINGTSITMDDKQFTLSKPMVDISGKKYLPCEFITEILGGEVTHVSVSYLGDTSYYISATVPNPLYVEE